MILQDTRARHVAALQSPTSLELRAWPDISAAARRMRIQPLSWREIALLVGPQLLLGAVIVLIAFIAKMMGG
jgi:hypothetical protein